MTVSKELIQNVKDLKTALNEISVYDLNVYTSMELYYKIANKLNEVIKELARFEGVVSDEVVYQNEKLIYLLGEGLNIEVVKKINQMVTDGTMDSIINHNVFNGLNSKIDTFKQEVNEQFNTIGINIKNFGAKGDGVTDDTQSIINSINFANENGFKKVFFPNGTYLIKSSLTFKGGLIYEGNKSIIKQHNETSYLTCIENVVEFRGLIFDGSNITMRTLYLNGCENFKIKNCEFKNTTKYGLHLLTTKKGMLENCKFYNSGRNDFMSCGVAINGSDIQIYNCEASGNLLGNGFLVYSNNDSKSINISFDQCLAKDNKQHGFITCHTENIENRNENISFINCIANGNGGIYGSEYMYGGIVIHDSNNSLISNCVSINNFEHGIAIMDSDNINVVDNICKSNKRCGIRLQADWSRPQDTYSGVKKCLISNNQCISNGIEEKYWSSGVLIEGNCHYITCNNNILNDNYYSIYLKEMLNFNDCTNIYLEKNIMYGNKIINDLKNTMASGSVFGENFINGVRTKIDTILNEQTGYVAYSITDKLVDSKLNVENNALYHITTGNVVINGVTDTNMKVGTTFYVCLKTGSDQHSITINNGDGINLPSPLVISKANANNELIFKFVKTAGTGFRLLN